MSGFSMSASGAGQRVSLTRTTFPTKTAVDTVLSDIVLPTGWTVTLVGDFGGRVKLSADGKRILAAQALTSVASGVIKFRAQDAANENAVERTIPVSVRATIITPVHSFNSRLVFANGRNQATVAVLENSGDLFTMISPPWDTKCPRLWFAGFYGQTAVGEAPIGNDVNYEIALIEINDTKYTLLSGGKENFVVPNGGFASTDVNEIKIPANSIVRFGWALNVASGGYYPNNSATRLPLNVFSTPSGRGDAGSAASTSRKTFVQNNTTGNPAGATRDNTLSGAPALITCMPDGLAAEAAARSVLITGDSVGWGQNDFQAGFGLTVADYFVQGYCNRAMNNATGGRIPFINLAVPGTRLPDLTLSGSQSGEAGSAGFAMRRALLEAAGFPFSTRIMQMGINSVSAPNNSTELLTKAQAAVDFLAMLGGNGRKTAILTLSPHTTAQNDGTSTGNDFMWVSPDESKQNRVADGNHVAFDNWALGKPANVDMVFDIRSAFESSAGSRKWGRPANNSGTLSAAVAAGANVLTTDFKPNEGDTLVIESGVAGQVENLIVTSVSGSAAPYTVNRKGTFSKAHAQGVALQGAFTVDGIHPSRQSSVAGSAALAALKGQII